jgi:hypothetical protein
MSLATFKKKSAVRYGSNRSGKGPGGYWLPQGPFGHATLVLQTAIDNPGMSGFSINGGTRNVGYVGKTYQMSKSGTPFRGEHPIGNGGTYGKYPSAILVGDYSGAISNSSKTAVVQPVLNSRVNTSGTQYAYIKPSVLSTKGMLAKRFRWVYNGQYPNFWVQPVYTGNQTDTKSQLLYIQNKAAANTCNLKVNNTTDYEGYIKYGGPTLCTPGRSTAMFKYNDMARNGPYTKILGQPVSYTQYNSYITQKCNNPRGDQKPFPFATQTGTGILTGGTSVSRVGSSCGTSDIYLTPPDWYTDPPPIPFTGNTPA